MHQGEFSRATTSGHGVQRRQVLAAGLAWAGASGAAPAAFEAPEPIRVALRQSGLPPQALGWVVLPLTPARTPGLPMPTLSWQARQPFTPASLSKLVTSYAALDRLGPAFTWRTAVLWRGLLRDGVLTGDLRLRGSGDPVLVHERLWRLLRQVRQRGVREIRGDIVLDRQVFAPIATAASDFDQAAGRPYNVQPDGLLLNYHALTLHLRPDIALGQAHVSVEPTLAGLEVAATVPLSETASACDNLRQALQIQHAASSAGRLSWAGVLPRGCTEEVALSVAYADPGRYAARLIEAMWREVGGTLSGRVRDAEGPVEAHRDQLLVEHVSPPLSQVVQDMNKSSNNVMAEQVFLTLAARAQPTVSATHAQARAVVEDWVRSRLGPPEQDGPWVLDNGSGLSRQARCTPLWLARLLHDAFHSPVMPELMASLPIAGVDGTLRQSQARPGRAHLKTGTLRDASGVAGYVLDAQGRHHVLVAMASHPQAFAARRVFDALVDWVVSTSPPQNQ